MPTTTYRLSDPHKVIGPQDFSTSDVTLKDQSIPRVARDLTEEAVLALPLGEWRVHDAPLSTLPTTAANDDFGFIAGTFGTDAPILKTIDCKTLGATSIYARLFHALGNEYEHGETLKIRIHGGMNTTVADTSATVDVEVYVSDGEGDVGSDLCATAAQSINGATGFDDYDFTITATGLSPGTILNIRVAMAINDAAGSTAVIGQIGKTSLVRDINI